MMMLTAGGEAEGAERCLPVITDRQGDNVSRLEPASVASLQMVKRVQAQLYHVPSGLLSCETAAVCG
jgi:hypothetical protein